MKPETMAGKTKADWEKTCEKLKGLLWKLDKMREMAISTDNDDLATAIADEIDALIDALAVVEFKMDQHFKETEEAEEASEIMYLCDPDKNTKCSKRICHKNALCKVRGDKRCKITRNPDFAVTDEKGEKVILLRKHNRDDGDSYFYEATEMGKNLLTFP